MSRNADARLEVFEGVREQRALPMLPPEKPADQNPLTGGPSTPNQGDTTPMFLNMLLPMLRR
ncbi:Hypothetical protein A7982_07364 [Minicystis rosea]|nr:Hypothetical protein A7982_07364 [Minicystis rosea]